MSLKWIRLILVLLVVGAALGLLLAFIFGDELLPEYSPYQRGVKVAAQAGCFACHGGISSHTSFNPSHFRDRASFSKIPSIFEERHSVEVLRESVALEDGLFSSAASIISRNCLKCHGPEKQRSDYRVDTRDRAFQGGEIGDFLNTVAVVPGNSKGGLLIQFVEALEEDLDNEIYPMPPDGNPRLSAGEIQVLKAWINRGARWPEG